MYFNKIFLKCPSLSNTAEPLLAYLILFATSWSSKYFQMLILHDEITRKFTEMCICTRTWTIYQIKIDHVPLYEFPIDRYFNFDNGGSLIHSSTQSLADIRESMSESVPEVSSEISCPNFYLCPPNFASKYNKINTRNMFHWQ